jgi:hypothetical protein
MDFLIHNPQNLFWLAAAIVSGYMLFGRNVIGDPDSITPQQAVLLLNKEDAIVVDVRDQAEFSAGICPMHATSRSRTSNRAAASSKSSPSAPSSSSARAASARVQRWPCCARLAMSAFSTSMEA